MYSTNTPHSPTPAYPELFRGPFYNHRRPSLARPKPVVRKLIGVSTWICHMRDLKIPQQPGFGLTPTEAYNDWKRRC